MKNDVICINAGNQLFARARGISPDHEYPGYILNKLITWYQFRILNRSGSCDCMYKGLTIDGVTGDEIGSSILIFFVF